MAGIISKAIRGAATAGAQLSMEQYRANIMAQRDAKLREYSQQDKATAQQFQSSEREAGQEFSAAENEKNRKNQLALQEKRNEKTTGTTGKVPEYEKLLRRQAAEAYGSALGDQFSFEGDNAQKAAQLSRRSVEIYKAMESPDTTVAHEQALKELRAQEDEARKLEDARAQAEKEAKGRGGLFGEGFGDVGQDEWINQRVQEITGGGVINKAMKPAGSPAGEKPALPPINERKVNETIVDTPKGKAIWKGDGWELINAAQ